MRKVNKFRLFIAGLFASAVLAFAPVLPLNAVVSPHVSENPADYTPHVIAGNINAYAAVGTTMYAGGTISTVKSFNGKETHIRHNIMAFDARTGKILPFAPVIDGQVWSISPSESGKFLFVGGSFQTVDGVARRGVVKYDLVNNRVDPTFNANLDARATVVQVVRYRLIIAGSFSKVGNTPRAALASVNTTTGAVNNYINEDIAGRLPNAASEPTRIYRFSVSPDQTRLIMIGNFTSVSGQSRQQVAMLNLDDIGATLSGWNSWYFYQGCFTSLPWYFRDADWSSDSKYSVLVSTGGPVKRLLCDTASRWETPGTTAGDSVPTWINYTGGDSLHSVKIVGDIVYIGGHQRWLDNPEGADFAGPGSVSRPGIGAIDAVSGKATSWNPTRTRGVGAKELFYSTVPDATGLWVGSDTAELGHEYHASIGFLPQ